MDTEMVVADNGYNQDQHVTPAGFSKQEKATHSPFIARHKTFNSLKNFNILRNAF